MAEVQTSEVGAKPPPITFGLSKLNFGSHGNQTVEALLV
jgi:hypothetical protein